MRLSYRNNTASRSSPFFRTNVTSKNNNFSQLSFNQSRSLITTPSTHTYRFKPTIKFNQNNGYSLWNRFSVLNTYNDTRKFSDKVQLNEEKLRQMWSESKEDQVFSELDNFISQETSSSSASKDKVSEAYSLRGIFKFESKKFEGALEDFAKAIEWNGSNHTAHAYRASIHLQKGEYEDAVNGFTDAIRSNPKNHILYVNRAFANRRIGNSKEAVEDYTKALEIAPNELIPLHERARTRLGLGEMEGALEDLNTVIEKKPDFLDAYAERCNLLIHMQHTNEAIADASRIIELNPPEEMARNAYYLRGMAKYTLNKDPNEILHDINKAVENGLPEEPMIHVMRGNLHLTLNEMDEALKCYESALENNVNDVEAQVGLANTYYSKDEPDKAVEWISKAIEQVPEAPRLLVLRAASRIRIGEYQEALDDCEKALELFQGSPEGADVYLHRGTAHLALGNFSQCIEDCTRAVEHTPDDYQGYFFRAQGYAKLEDEQKAIDDLKIVMKLAPDMKDRVNQVLEQGNLKETWEQQQEKEKE